MAHTTCTSARVRPDAASPRSNAGSVIVSSDSRVVNGCVMRPSATSPATATMRGPKPPTYTGGRPNGLGPGSNAGIINVWR